MSQPLRSKQTGIAWASDFAKYDIGSGAAFITGRPSLPNAHWDIEQHVQWLRDVLDHYWDIGQRVQCLRDILDQSGLSRSVSWVEFEPESLAMIKSFHSSDYIESVRMQSREVALLGL